MKRNILKSVALLFAVAVCACKEENNGPVYGAGPAPSPVSNVVATPAPGGADITYSLPDDADLLYVKAEVVTPDGKFLSAESSSHNNKISIRGLANTNPQDVTLYSINKGGVRSEGYTLTINPLIPPYLEVFESIKIKEDFGGINMTFSNESNASLAFVLNYLDEKTGEYVEHDAYYTEEAVGNYSFRGFKAEPYKFGIYIRDRWDHISPMNEAELTPRYEELLNKSKFKKVTGIQGDGWNSDRTGFGYGDYFVDVDYNKIENLWNGVWSPTIGETSGGLFYIEKADSGEKAAFTFDLGQAAQLSRIRYSHQYPWNHYDPREFEVYGRTDLPESVLAGDWDDWTLLAKVRNDKPSGLPYGEWGPGDAEAYAAGMEFNVDINLPKIRYIRTKCIESWGGNTNLAFTEVTVWGDPR